MQEKEEELKVNQQKLSDLSRKVLDLESAEYLAKQKDDLIEKLEDTKKEVRDIYYKKKDKTGHYYFFFEYSR